MQAENDDPRYRAAASAWDDLKSARSEHELDWDELARLIRTQRGGHQEANSARHRGDKPFSSAPLIAATNFSAGLYGTLTNPANRWMSLRAADNDLADWKPMRDWQDRVSSIVLRSFQPHVSPFYSAAPQLYGDLTVFGNAAQYDEVRPAEGKILDITLSLAEICYDIDGFGRVVEVIRRFSLSPAAAVDMFGGDNLPAKIVDNAIAGRREKSIFYHHVRQNRDYEKGRLGPRGKAWSSIYSSEVGAAVVRHNGYDEMPFTAPRWEVDTGQTYGRGPGYIALPDARALNLTEAANLRAGQKAADPTLLAPERDTWPLHGQVRPGEVIYGGVSATGQRLVQSLDNYGGTGLTLEMSQQRISQIRDAFHWSLMSLAGRTGMTATEVIEMQEEKLRLMAPHMGRVQDEYLAPKIARRFSLLWRAGQIPPPPPEAGGAGLRVEYLSAAAMAQRSAEGAATVRLIADLAPLAAIKPRLMDRIDEDGLVESLAEARGAPAQILRSRADADRIAEGRAQQAAQDQAMQIAQAGGGVARDLASAQAQMQGAGAA